MCPTFDSNLAARNRNLIIFLVPGFLMDEQATSFLSWLLNLFLYFFCADVLKTAWRRRFVSSIWYHMFQVGFFNPKRLLRVWNFFPLSSTIFYTVPLLPYEKYSQLFGFICLIPWNDYLVDWTLRWLVFCLKSPKSRKTASWEKTTTKNWGTILLSNCINA